MKAQAAEKVKAQVQKVKDKAQAIVDDIAVSSLTILPFNLKQLLIILTVTFQLINVIKREAKPAIIVQRVFPTAKNLPKVKNVTFVHILPNLRFNPTFQRVPSLVELCSTNSNHSIHDSIRFR